jgi:hypothetical protein
MGRNPTSETDRKAFRSNLTGILLIYMRRSFPPISISEQKLFSATLKKQQRAHRTTHITSKNKEHSLIFNYTMNMVHHNIIRPCLLQRLRVE